MLATIQSVHIKYILLVSILILLGIATAIYFIFFRGQTPTDAHTTIEQSSKDISTEGKVAPNGSINAGSPTNEENDTGVFNKLTEGQSCSGKNRLHNENNNGNHRKEKQGDTNNVRPLTSPECKHSSHKQLPFNSKLATFSKNTLGNVSTNTTGHIPERQGIRSKNLTSKTLDTLESKHGSTYILSTDERKNVEERLFNIKRALGPDNTEKPEYIHLLSLIRTVYMDLVSSQRRRDMIVKSLHNSLVSFLNDVKKALKSSKNGKTASRQSTFPSTEIDCLGILETLELKIEQIYNDYSNCNVEAMRKESEFFNSNFLKMARTNIKPDSINAHTFVDTKFIDIPIPILLLWEMKLNEIKKDCADKLFEKTNSDLKNLTAFKIAYEKIKDSERGKPSGISTVVEFDPIINFELSFEKTCIVDEITVSCLGANELILERIISRIQPTPSGHQ